MMAAKPLLPRVETVEPLDGYRLRLKFKDGMCKLFDVNPYLQLPAFQRLTTGNLFYSAHVERGTVVWDDQLDLSPDTLYLEGQIFPVAQNWQHIESKST